MSRRGDFAYGSDIPQRWDRDRFERFTRSPPARYEEDYRFIERDRPGRRDITIVDHIDERGPRGRFDERDRYWEEERRVQSRPRRRTDRELFGDVDPRELAGMALTPYRRKSISREEADFVRPTMMRRQSSLDTFDRRPSYVEREEFRIPIRHARHRDDYYYEPEDYREVEIRRERSVHRSRPPPPPSSTAKSSKAKSSKTKSRATASVAPTQVTSSSSSSESVTEVEEDIEESIHESIVDTQRKFKKGKTRMPKRLVRREAIMDLGYPFDEEEDFFVLRIALEKEQIDEVMRISETYKGGEKSEKESFHFEEKIEESESSPAREREEIIRTEWLNPPSVAGKSSRPSRSRSRHTHKTSVSHHHHHHSHSHSHSRRASSPPSTYLDESVTIVESPPPPSAPAAPVYETKTIIEERSPGPNYGALVVQERDSRSDRDIQSEIRALEAERRALRLEREADEKREKALRLRERPDEEYQLVEYREARPRDVLEIVERKRSPSRNVLRVEKDRKGRMALVRSSH